MASENPQLWYKTKDLAESYNDFQRNYLSASRHLCLQLAYRRLEKCPGRILDLGCGTGASIPVLLDLFPGAQIIGLDPEESMLNVAISRNKWDNVRFVKGSSDEFPSNLGCFDFIFSFSSFRLWNNPVSALTQIQSSLTEDGLCYIADLRKDVEMNLTINFINSANESFELVANQMAFAYSIKEVEVILKEAEIVNYLICDQPFKVLFKDLRQRELLFSKYSKENNLSQLKSQQQFQSILMHLFLYPKEA